MFKAGEQQMTAMSRNKELKFHEAKLKSISRRLHSIRAMTNVGQVGFGVGRRRRAGGKGLKEGPNPPAALTLSQKSGSSWERGKNRAQQLGR